MGKVIDRLEVMANMNKRLKRDSFEQLFRDDEFTIKFVDFVGSRQHEKWLTKPEGRLYTRWNSS